MNNQIIAIWGNPFSGKTSLSIKIAEKLSLKKKNVIVVFSDIISPTIMTVLPYIKTENKSLGRILSAPEINQEEIMAQCIVLEKNPHISLLGYLQGENIFTYAQYSKERAVDFLILLRHIADYVIIDCSSLFAYNTLSAVALEMSDSVIRLCSSNLKAVAYFNSYLPLLEDRKFNVDKHIKVLSKVKISEPREQIKEIYRGVKYELPYTEEIEKQLLTAELFNKLKDKSSFEYSNTLNDLVSVILEESVGIKSNKVKNSIAEINPKYKNTSLFRKAFIFGKGGSK
ncbi:ParA family protein [Hathewaya limosa]|uniref:MinD-like ATPase involved in chromosome partitioning or flagellar assembly n=1 Tax=Hathewaya limosa TaxID=1536 RepID=A0ABU0JPS3_HATLI|nr:ParA family protein [Hathewaya limosa]MDQ0479088.1 MinD-like ATPase involved in chromosome partitioning or flagellar assembly [Hathewaya limosa]